MYQVSCFFFKLDIETLNLCLPIFLKTKLKSQICLYKAPHEVLAIVISEGNMGSGVWGRIQVHIQEAALSSSERTAYSVCDCVSQG